MAAAYEYRHEWLQTQRKVRLLAMPQTKYINIMVHLDKEELAYMSTEDILKLKKQLEKELKKRRTKSKITS